MDFIANFTERFQLNFIKDDRWIYIADGLKVTLTVTFFSVLIGIVLGFMIALVRATYDRTGKKMFQWERFGDCVLWFFNLLAKLYLTVIRGTPVVVQLLIIYFVIFASVDIDKVLVAVIAFGINSAAYVAEIFRGGIESIPKGQYEAGQVLGMTKTQTFFNVVLLQVVKRVVPPMGNEIITLVKDTSLARVIAVYEIIWSAQAYIKLHGLLWPLLYTAVFYLLFSGLLTLLFGYIEKKLDYFKA